MYNVHLDSAHERTMGLKSAKSCSNGRNLLWAYESE